MSTALYYLFANLRFGALSRRREIKVPLTKIIFAILRLLQVQGLIVSFRKEKTYFVVEPAYSENGTSPLAGLRCISTPGRRIFLSHGRILQRYGRSEFVLISTSHGLRTLGQLRRFPAKLGGEILCVHGKN